MMQGGFGRWPQLWPGVTGPLLDNPPAEIETPEIYRLGVGPSVTFRQFGLPVGQISRDWGFDPDSRDFDRSDRTINPADAAEVIRWFDVQRCVNVPETAIEPGGVLYEISKVVVPTGHAAVVEKIPVSLDIDALDLDHAAIFSVTIDGRAPCTTEQIHPDPDVGEPLRWRWSLTQSHESGTPSRAAGYVGPVSPTSLEGWSLLPPWTDARNGHRSRFADDQQIVVGARRVVHLWCELSGARDRYRVRIGGRLSGYLQAAGRRSAALLGITRRPG